MRQVALALLLLVAPALLDVGDADAGRKRTVLVADFEDPIALDHLAAEGLTYVRVKALGEAEGHYLRAVAAEDARVSTLTFQRVPADIRAFEALTLRARVLLDPVAAPRLTLVDENGRRLQVRFVVKGKAWSTLRIPLARAREDRGFDPTQVESLRLGGCRALEIDDLSLVEGHGDWRVDGVALLAAFGERRVKRVRRVRTRHFDVCTDSIAARGTFLVKLEATYDFVRDALGVQDVGSRIPVTLFQSQGGFIDYLVRVRGWTRGAAGCVAGIAHEGTFTSWYMAPQGPVVTHELTHAIFHRRVGRGGGSWLQEGVAEYVEDLHHGRSAARGFAHRLRHGRYVPLTDFLTMRSIARVCRHDGRRYSATDLYDQAGAFFEFLRHGPLLSQGAEVRAGGLPPQIAALADGATRPTIPRIERCLGHTIAEIEQTWIQWGRRPPRPAAGGGDR